MSDLEALKVQYSQKKFIIVGNTFADYDFVYDEQCVYIALNGSLPFFYQNDICADFLWVQDKRFIQNKLHLLEPYLSHVRHQVYNIETKSLFPNDFFQGQNPIFISPIGYLGFSENIKKGFYHGYNAAFGALQLAFFFQPESVLLYGVELSYSLHQKRYYNQSIAFDFDLHVLEKQLFSLNEAKEIFNSNNIDVQFTNNLSRVNRLISLRDKSSLLKQFKLS